MLGPKFPTGTDEWIYLMAEGIFDRMSGRADLKRLNIDPLLLKFP